ncbi:hypothetical protein FB192DRAFT_1288171 [Mucor lusitanicus]|uniref:non-specific serine/threonine protein kinase n=1 Tax=Mucor circinelloides f. lusitanicus TaxID=29924 RepID=A0A8H4EXR9_MUCCL|nr:hypothetical protein FB192DRAFT_1288171 [Mucor lusitanicus]
MTSLISAATHSTPKRPVQKKQNKLGPYNLLQTLGEGEFGKVKLGIHIETGQETLNHPYIVKLYNVVETEKYIGIILEYASGECDHCLTDCIHTGGELFEYILAHRYLKEKDAKRFFAQLISSVQYMHKRKIVHRDLKLENLLLDKNRNIIVTDFGFANQFASAADDMMATTCGSPCYAAPELVVNAGLYAGSAVDIWSCGVILYAMLCGFLPFDDDPSNPDSDNINQLYRYILSTNLMFPSHVGVDARDLLAKMLVPDPAKRCSLDYIVKHPWLESYRQFLKKDAAQLEMEALAASRLSTMPDTHIPVTTRDRFAPVANDKYLVANHKLSNAVTEKPLSATLKSPSQKTSSFRHFSIGRSSATTTTVEKPIHATNVKTSKVPNFITRKPIKKEEEAAAANNDSAITVASATDDVHPEKSLSSPQMDQDASAVGSIRRNQRRGADKFLSFFTGGRTSHIPNVNAVRSTTSTITEDQEGEANASNGSQYDGTSSVLSQRQQQLPERERGSSSISSASILSEQGANSSLHSSSIVSFKDAPRRTTPLIFNSQKAGSSSLALRHQQFSNGHVRIDTGSSIVSSSADDGGRKAMAAVRRSIYRKHKSQPPPPSAANQQQQQASNSQRNSAPVTERKEPLISFAKSRFEETNTSTGKKMMEWIKKKSHVISILAPPSSSTQHKPLAAALEPEAEEEAAEKEELVVPEHNSIRRKNRALSGSETAIAELEKKQGTVDERIEIHQGAIDRKALTSQSPALVIKDVARILHILGIDTTLESPYILKCCRRKAKASIAAELLKQQSAEADPIYGDAAIDNGDEIRFVVEMCRFKNLPGLYIVDIRRVRGNAWAYKFLYHKLIDFLDLGKDNYMQSSK